MCTIQPNACWCTIKPNHTNALTNNQRQCMASLVQPHVLVTQNNTLKNLNNICNYTIHLHNSTQKQSFNDYSSFQLIELSRTDQSIKGGAARQTVCIIGIASLHQIGIVGQVVSLIMVFVFFRTGHLFSNLTWNGILFQELCLKKYCLWMIYLLYLGKFLNSSQYIRSISIC